MEEAEATTWRFVHFGLIVTGKGEALFLPDFLRALTKTQRCHFEVIDRLPQLAPITSPRRLQAIGSRRSLPARAEEAGFNARAFLNRSPGHHVLIIDDVEAGQAPHLEQKFERYRGLFAVLRPGYLVRASVHFLRNMIEAYYFADAQAVNRVAGQEVLAVDHPEDVEDIVNPKAWMKRLFPGFDQVEHGQKIVGHLDLEHILSNPRTCLCLRSLSRWCTRATGEEFTDRFQLLRGEFFILTDAQ